MFQRQPYFHAVFIAFALLQNFQRMKFAAL